MDLFNYTAIAIDRHVKVGKLDSLDQMQAFLDSCNYTIRDILEYTPTEPEQNIIHGCGLRLASSYTFETYSNSSKCRQLFEIEQYYHQEYVCYTFCLKDSSAIYHYRNLGYALDYPNTWYYIDLDIDTFKLARYFKAIIHEKELKPFESSSLATITSRFVNNVTNEAIFNCFRLTYTYYSKRRLPAPYGTNCVDYSNINSAHKDQAECQADCRIKASLIAFNQYPFSEAYYDKLNKSHIQSHQLRDVNLSKQLNKIERGCSRVCGLDCEWTRFISYVTSEPYHGVIRFMMNVPRDLAIEVQSKPFLDFAEFVVYVLSTFGTWFGLSVLGLNPFQGHFKRLTRTKIRRKRIDVTEATMDRTRTGYWVEHIKALELKQKIMARQLAYLMKKCA